MDAMEAYRGHQALIELANIRRLLIRHGVPEADRHGVGRPTVAMVEDFLVSRGPTTPPG